MTTRRAILTLLVAGGLAGPSRLVVAPAAAQTASFDLVIRGGDVLDGTGAPARRADVGIRGDAIAVVGDLSRARASRTRTPFSRSSTRPRWLAVNGQPVIANGAHTGAKPGRVLRNVKRKT